ncbi:MAG TPA: Hsp20/alpha crystallin family protein [Candidatus Acidoferrum sp.]|nr:Hsp20/alpha crystallin family protein [Candidatus Acidoferrum sp.]
MRYRRSSIRYATVVGGGQTWVVGDVWQSDRLRWLVRTGFRPDVDAYETAATLEVVVDLAGVDEDDYEIQLFADALIVEGHRRLSGAKEAAIYHAASIRQGPFRVEIPLPAAIDPERVEARYERGLLRITLPKAGAR